MLDFGSLNPALERSCASENLERSIRAVPDYDDYAPEIAQALKDDTAGAQVRNVLRSIGPVADAYIMAHADIMLITGPGGSGKTTASVKKSLVETQRIFPAPDRVRRYTLGVWRQKYDNLWKATIPSWWKILPADLPGSKWVGSSPRAAQHIVNFDDGFGRCQLIARFRAFGDIADPLDLLGNEFTDCYLNEMPTLPEELLTGLIDRIGRDPPAEIIKRGGAIFGDGNAPDVLNYTYRDFYEDLKPGYALFRQPGGRHPDAENMMPIGAMDREYYHRSARLNAHRSWWVRVMVDAKPGYIRANDPVYPKFDDDRNMAIVTLHVYRELPVLVGVDNPMKPAAVYAQERGDGQLRILAEIALERGGVKELADAMLALEARRFAGCDFVTTCDPAMGAGEDLAEGSDRLRLAKYLARSVALAPTNSLDARVEWLGCKFDLSVADGPGLVIDPVCKAMRRGLNQTYAWRDIGGTDDRGSIAKTADSHVVEAAQYGASVCGSSQARHRRTELAAATAKRREEARQAARYSPLRRWKAGAAR
jgi:hypothetical protein